MEGGVAIVEIDSPPVNALSHRVRSGLHDAFERLGRDPGVDAIVLLGMGRGFSAGGDRGEIGTAAARANPRLAEHVHPVIEACAKPTVAAIHGFAIGGGLETALACRHRVVTRDAKIGLPEATVGLVPPSGALRLPRLLGLARALDMIVSGDLVQAAAFSGTRMFDRIVTSPDDLRAVALDVARTALDAPLKPLVRDLPAPVVGAAKILSSARQRAVDGVSESLIQSLVDVVAIGIDEADFDVALKKAIALHDKLAEQLAAPQRGALA